jgi:hypothetical protein
MWYVVHVMWYINLCCMWCMRGMLYVIFYKYDYNIYVYTIGVYICNFFIRYDYNIYVYTMELICSTL